ncbi:MULTISPECIES: isoamylase early set domain-containing protein [Flagellimonas]|uniref:Glycoside hydrolase n=1 Tax=Flagellimonas hadalis TaxID=2597517 RepID=A0A5N5IVX1_9FLAO|nr:isoamylase early set domain-containing protein [Allomuricauda hadalis]KAB5490037.1 glycoside hydrolase [Allomuricauda hadalis]RUA12264.1 MAG: glycoside hydrolase [Flavobacteriia bacterium]
MAIKKQYLKSKPICKVTFTVPADEAETVAVVGDFNNWNPTASELKKLKNGTFKGTFELPMENSYEFRYLIDGNFTNDEEADRFQWNEYAGTENAVLEV